MILPDFVAVGVGANCSSIYHNSLLKSWKFTWEHKMHIVVVGAGGVGGYFGGRLAQAGEQVTFIGRGVHLKAM